MSPKETSSPRQILIVDDTPANLRLLAGLLSDQGYAVRLAPSGNLALMAIQQHVPDLILLDIRMPKMDGYAVCRQLKVDARTADIPIIFLSALQEGEDKVKAFEAGGADYITKPFQAEEVTARVRQQLRLLDLQRQLQAQNQKLQQEISDRQQAQTALEQERNLLRTLINAIPDFIFFKDPKGRYLLWNQTFQAYVDREPQAILHRTDADLFPPEVAKNIVARDHQVLTTGLPLRYESTATLPDQQQRSLDIYKVPIHNRAGELLGLIGICHDITARKASEDYLSRTTSRLSTLISSLQAGILVENEHRRIALANQGFCDLFGMNLSPATLVGADCEALASRSAAIFASPQPAIQRINEILARRQAVTSEELTLADGRILERDYMPIMAGDRFQGHLWQYRDITSRKASERALVMSSQRLRAFSNNLKQLHRLSVQQFETFAELSEDYLKTGCQILKFTGGVITQLAHDTLTLKAVESPIPEIFQGLQCNLDDVFCATAIQTHQTVIQDHFGATAAAATHPLYQAFGLESFISTPIWVNEQIYGSLCFFSAEIRTAGFHSHEKEIIELMAQSIGKFISAYQIEQQRLQAEGDLRESEARFRQLAEHIENVFWILEPEAQQFTYLSPAYESMWGRSREAALQDPQNWYEAIHPQEQAGILAKQAQGEGYDEEYRIIRPDGNVRWVRDRAFPICDESGRPYRIVGIAEDITDLKHQEQALRLIFEGTAAKTGSQFFRSLVRYLADVLQVHYALITQTVGHTPPRVKFLAFWQDGEFGENYELELINSPCAQVLQGESVFHDNDVQSLYPEFQPFKDWHICSYFGVPLINSNNEVIGHLAVLDDRPMLPEQTRELILKIFAARAGAELERQTFENEIQLARESADAANRAKSEFLANISHELRTPLNSILGFTQLLLSEHNIAPTSRDYLDIVYRSGEHLLALINDVLEMSKIEAGKLSLMMHPFDLHDLLHNLEEMFSLRAIAKNIALSLQIAPTVPQYIETDESKLRQVLINLLSNAVKFTQAGQVTLTVEAMLPTADPALPADTVTVVSQSRPIVITFRVEDTGPGIAPEEINNLFSPFTQTTAGYQSREGTGLGLSISQRFVQLMGGRIEVQSQVGSGATFSFFLEAHPVYDVPVPKTSQTTLNPVEQLAPGQPDYRILVVEDRPANRFLLVRFLESIGFTVRAVEDGNQAVTMASDWRPHLIWMDICMPNLDGYEATRQIKAAQLSPQPIIIGLTANAFEDERQRVLTAGCDDFVRKPFKAEQIFQIMAQYLPIQYIYKTDTESAGGMFASVNEIREPMAEDMAGQWVGVNQEWVESIRQAAIKGADEQILQLVTELPEQHLALAQALTYWATNFQFGAILDALPPD